MNLQTQNSKERWKDVPGYIGFYKISSIGRIKSVTRDRPNSSKRLQGKFMRPHLGNNGYLSVVLSKHGVKEPCLMHRLVAIAFIKNPKIKPQVNHKDGNRQNNNVNNLEWVTCSENAAHSFRCLGRKNPTPFLGKTGLQCHNSKQVAMYSNGIILDAFESCSDAALKLDSDFGGISRSARSNGALAHKGYFFKRISLKRYLQIKREIKPSNIKLGKFPHGISLSRGGKHVAQYSL